MLKEFKPEQPPFSVTFSSILAKLKAKNSLFITGSAGSGKSYLLQRLKEHLTKDLTLTASTGVAALNIGGVTIHSFAKLGIGMDSFEKILYKIEKDSKAQKRIFNTKVLAIDEISMLSSKFLNLINKVFKAVKKNDEPFGGVTLALFGDFLQLPPIIKEENETLCLNCESWREAEIETVVLRSNYRQKNDGDFFEILQSIRLGENLDFAYEKLKSRITQAKAGGRVIKLVSHREQALKINLESLSHLKDGEKNFIAEYEGKPEFVRAYLPLFTENSVIKLKKGARVMLNFNLKVDEGLCNGTLGFVVDFNDKGYPIVLFDEVKAPVLILKNDFVVEDPFSSEVLFRFTQIPLQLAYGITIHKSQGLTFDSITTDISRCFAPGQAYVSLSRARSLNGLFLEPFNKNIFKTDAKIVEYYKRLGI